MKKIISVLLIICIFSIVNAKEVGKAFNVKNFILDNGLEVIINENHDIPQVTGILVVKAGSKDEPLNATGLAHYLEHMVFKGTDKIGAFDFQKEKVHLDNIKELYRKMGMTTDEDAINDIQKQINKESIAASQYVNSQEFNDILYSMGAKGINASTSYDRTNYFSNFPKNQIDKWLATYSEVFRNPVFRGFQNELEVVYEEYNLRSAESPEYKAQVKLFESIFKNKQYRIPIIGKREHLKKPSLDEMIKFYKNYYVPNNMVLILSGDIYADEVRPKIEKTFGSLVSKDVKTKPIVEEQSFQGRENVQIRYARSLSEGILAFHCPEAKSEDNLVLDVIQNMLSNNGRTGVLDKLVYENDDNNNLLLNVYSFNFPFKEIGNFFIGFIPGFEFTNKKFSIDKMNTINVDALKQSSLRPMEKIIFKEIDKLRKGNFDDQLLSEAKQQLLIMHKLNTENAISQGIMLNEAVAVGIPIERIINYEEYIKRISREDIKSIINKYITKNYLAFYNLRGKIKKDHVEKPDIKPLKVKLDKNTDFAEQIIEKEAVDFKREFIDFNEKVKRVLIKPNVRLHYVKNDKNDVFSMHISYNVGNIELPSLRYAAPLLNLAGITGQFRAFELRKHFGKLGCNYVITSDDNNLNITLYGNETNLATALALISKLLFIPDIDPDVTQQYISNSVFSRSILKKYPDAIADAAINYIMYGENSPYLTWMESEKLSLMGAKEVQLEFDKALSYGLDIYYYGNNDINEVYNTIKNNLVVKPDLKKGKDKIREYQHVDNSKIYFYDVDAVKSTIYLYQKLSAFNILDFAKVRAFNNYFSGGFSGLVLQKIREEKALAYSAGANIQTPNLPNNNFVFLGGVFTQNDKAHIAVKTFADLVNDAPKVEKGLNLTKKYIVNSILGNEYNPRYLAQTSHHFRKLGFTKNPQKILYEDFKNLSEEDILSYYEKNLKQKPLGVIVVGNKRKIDMDKLKAIAPIEKLRELQMIKK